MGALSQPSFNADDSASPSITLRLSLKGQAMQTFHFDKDLIVVGRDMTCDVCVDNPGVSRQHCRIERSDGGEYRVVDCGSSNGTYLNDKPIQVSTLRDGDALQISKYTIAISIDELVGRPGMERETSPSPEGATVVLKPSEVRQMVAEAKAAPALKVVPGRRPASPPPASAPVPSSDASARGWIVWLAVAGLVGAALVAWFAVRQA